MTLGPCYKFRDGTRDAMNDEDKDGKAKCNIRGFAITQREQGLGPPQLVSLHVKTYPQILHSARPPCVVHSVASRASLSLPPDVDPFRLMPAASLEVFTEGDIRVADWLIRGEIHTTG